MATKKRATKTGKKSAAKRTGEGRSVKVTGAFVEGDSPTIGSDDGTIEFDYVLPPDSTLIYADNLNIVHTPTEFVLSFLQTQPPLIKSGEDWDKIKTIESRCVARLVVSPMKMQDMLKVLAMNWQRYCQKYFDEGRVDAEENDAQTSGNEK